MVAVVGAIDVPCVSRKNVSFVCVDFFCPATGRTERAAVDYSNIRKIRNEDSPTFAASWRKMPRRRA
jgi:hypothetical protein